MCDSARKFSSIGGFGEELDELVYEGISNWFISFRSLLALFSGHFSYLIVQVCIFICGILTLIHARANGSRFVQFWWGAMIHGILSENGLAATKYWHAQAALMLFGKRLPLHMVFFYPSILYIAVMGLQHFNLSPCCESAATGLLVMMMEIPFRIISVRFLHITYHDSDPSYASKFYGVPWVEIFSAFVFASSYTCNYYVLKHHCLSEDHIKWKRVEYEKKEAIVTAVVAVVSPIIAIIKKIIFFHVLHDSFNVNPPTCLFLLSSIYFSVILIRDTEMSKEEKEPQKKTLLYYAIGVYLMCLLLVAMFCRPQNEISIGAHEPTGDCTTLICTRTPLGKVINPRERIDFPTEFSGVVLSAGENVECSCTGGTAALLAST
ncbi:UNVERIFIED_CONTAM: hypothetical protein PYX00_010468 [Menopon gallinae]|uniref:DUF7802 domain-containing protein n=1 Tax=Menopon gallinae TaxID=328185 RepID=A0AAW2HG87_9NEOP